MISIIPVPSDNYRSMKFKQLLSIIFETSDPLIQYEMPQIKNLKNGELLNLLTAHTTLYTQMLTNNIKTEELISSVTSLSRFTRKLYLLYLSQGTVDACLKY